MSAELRECPFCDDARVGENNNGTRVVCSNCGAAGPLLIPEGDAVHAWNRRAPSAEREMLAECERELPGICAVLEVVVSHSFFLSDDPSDRIALDRATALLTRLRGAKGGGDER